MPIAAAPGLGSLLVLNSLRAATMLAATVGVVGAMLVARSGLAAGRSFPREGTADLLAVAMLIGVACPLLNWYLSLAAIFVVRDEESAFGALAKATDLCRMRPGFAGSRLAPGSALRIRLVFVVATRRWLSPWVLRMCSPGAWCWAGYCWLPCSISRRWISFTSAVWPRMCSCSNSQSLKPNRRRRCGLSRMMTSSATSPAWFLRSRPPAVEAGNEAWWSRAIRRNRLMSFRKPGLGRRIWCCQRQNSRFLARQ